MMNKQINGIVMPMTEEEIQEIEALQNTFNNVEAEIELIKQELSETDYKCLKYVDGALSEEEYATVREYRQSLRDKINELEKLL